MDELVFLFFLNLKKKRWKIHVHVNAIVAKQEIATIVLVPHVLVKTVLVNFSKT
tara:strand:+ start:169 stop:330 length:162 start_codon:yes stop_codon:yes gene_type:complete